MAHGHVLLFYRLKNKIDYLRLKLLYKERVQIGKGAIWRQHFTIHAMDEGLVKIGDNCFFNNNVTIFAKSSVTIGSNTMMGENVKIYDHNHRFSIPHKLFGLQGDNVAPIKIGNNCWIASNVTILKGVTIGDNCVIGAGCIVSEDVPDNSILRVTSPNYHLERIKGWT